MSDKNIPDNDAIVARADSLMHKKSRATAAPSYPKLHPLQDDEEDLPVLTDVVTPASTSNTPLELEAITEQLSQSIQRKLAAEIPVLVEAALHSTMAELTKTLHAGLDESIQAGIQDFLKDNPRNKS
ncbi:MAG: hypothetical protein ACRDD3_12055 [Azovibrio sp.]